MNSTDSLLLERCETLTRELTQCKNELHTANNTIVELHQHIIELEQMPCKHSCHDNYAGNSNMHNIGVEPPSHVQSVDYGVTTNLDSNIVLQTPTIQFGSISTSEISDIHADPLVSSYQKGKFKSKKYSDPTNLNELRELLALTLENPGAKAQIFGRHICGTKVESRTN